MSTATWGHPFLVVSASSTLYTTASLHGSIVLVFMHAAVCCPCATIILLVFSGELEPIAWSKGFVASARLLAQEFVTSRSLTPINGVILGPPGGNQITVCDQASINPYDSVVYLHVSAHGQLIAAVP